MWQLLHFHMNFYGKYQKKPYTYTKLVQENSDPAKKDCRKDDEEAKCLGKKKITSIASISTKKGRISLLSQFKCFSWAIL